MAVEVDRLVVTLEARLAGYEASMRRGQQVTNQALGQMEQRFQQMARNVNTTAIGIGTVLGTIGTYLTGRELVGYANAWTRVTRSISSGEQVFGTRLRSAEDLNALASDARVDLEAYAKLYVRTAGAIRDYGFEAGTAEKVTSTLAKALKLGGAAASEQASVLLQFSQALNKGKLDSDEFRSVMENANVVQELLADRLKVSKGEIIKMAAEGKLRIKDLVGAMVDGGDKIDRIFKQVPATMDEAATVLSNSITQYIGDLDKTYGITTTVTGATAVLARNIETVGDAAIVLSAGLLAAFSPRIVASVVGMAAATGALLSPLALILGGLTAAGVAFSVFGDDIKITEDGAVSLKDVFKGLTETIGATEVAIKKLDPGKDIVAGLAKEAKFARDEFKKLADQIEQIDLFPIEGGVLAPADGGPAREGIGSLIDRIRAEKALAGYGQGLGDYLSGKIPATKKGKPPLDTDVNKNSFERAIDQTKKRTEALLAEAKVYAESEAVKQRAITLENLIHEAKKNNIALTPDRIKAIEQVSDAYAKVSAEVAFLHKLRSAQEDADALQRELDLIGLTGKELERARIEQQLFNEAKRQGYELTPQREADIRALAERTAELKRQKEVMAEFADISKTAMRGFIDDMIAGKSAAEALAGVLSKIADKLLDFGVNSFVDLAAGGLKASGGIGAFGFASGGVVRGPGSGTSDSIPAMLSDGEYVINAQASAKHRALLDQINSGALARFANGGPVSIPRMAAARAGSGAGSVNISMPVTLNVENGTPAGVDKLNRETVPLFQQIARSEIANALDRHPAFSKLKG